MTKYNYIDYIIGISLINKFLKANKGAEFMNIPESVIKNLSSEDSLERWDSVDYLTDYVSDTKIRNIIIQMIDDKDYLVRCQACEALYGYVSAEILNKYIERLKNERSSIVRMYIISNITYIVNSNTIDTAFLYETLYKYYLKEKSKHSIIAYLALFYSLKKDIVYIYKALFYINDNDYHIRCNVINILNEVIDDENISIIINFYKNRLSIEEAFCVKDLLEDSIKTISRIENK